MMESKCCFNLTERKETMIEIEPCPFCGGEARILHGGLRCMATVECCKCGASVKAIDEMNPVEMAVQKWNTRFQNKALERILGYVRNILGWSEQTIVKKYMLEKIEIDASDALGVPSACR